MLQLIQTIVDVFRGDLREQRELDGVPVELRRPQFGIGGARTIARKAEEIDIPAGICGQREVARRRTRRSQRRRHVRELVAGGCRQLRPLFGRGGAARGACLENAGLCDLQVQIPGERLAHQAIKGVVIEFFPPRAPLRQDGGDRDAGRGCLPHCLQRRAYLCFQGVRRRTALQQ